MIWSNKQFRKRNTETRVTAKIEGIPKVFLWVTRAQFARDLLEKRRMNVSTRHCDALILGAGCAGTRLAAQLERRGYRGRVVLLDARADFGAPARWCGWLAPGLPPLAPDLEPLVSHRWHLWQTRDGAHTARCGDNATSYYHLDAPQFFAHFHARWRAQNGPIALRLGERVTKVCEDADGVCVTTASGAWRAPIVFDARHAGSAQLARLDAPGELRLHQDFVGWIVESARPWFDPQCATLMDFRLPQNDGVRFAYVLPFSPTRALVESTHFGGAPLAQAAHERALSAYLGETLGVADYQICARERGDLPMASAQLPEQLSARRFAIGVAGGAARASSGYAFARIEAQTARWAAALVRGDWLDGGGDLAGRERRARRKSAGLDGAFLEVMARDPALARSCFMRLFSRVPPASLARFLGERSTPADDARVIAALPKLPFCAAMRARSGARTGPRAKASRTRSVELKPLPKP